MVILNIRAKIEDTAKDIRDYVKLGRDKSRKLGVPFNTYTDGKLENYSGD